MYLSVRFSVTFRGQDDELHELHPRADRGDGAPSAGAVRPGEAAPAFGEALGADVVAEAHA